MRAEGKKYLAKPGGGWYTGIWGFPPIFSKMEEKQMKHKIAAALVCAGALAFMPVAGVTATLPGEVFVQTVNAAETISTLQILR